MLDDHARSRLLQLGNYSDLVVVDGSSNPQCRLTPPGMLLYVTGLFTVSVNDANQPDLKRAERVLGQLRNNCAGAMIVEAPVGVSDANQLAEKKVGVSVSKKIRPSFFYALGFQQLPEISDNVYLQARVLYWYSLENYKHQPDWLNARFWAHPERWHL